MRQPIFTSMALLVFAGLGSAQSRYPSEEGKTKQFAPGCTGSIRTLDTSVTDATASYKTYKVRFEFRHSCDRPMMPYFLVIYRAKRSDGDVIERFTEGPDPTCPIIKPGDPNPIIISARVDVDGGHGNEIIGKPYVSALEAKFSGWRGSRSRK